MKFRTAVLLLAALASCVGGPRPRVATSAHYQRALEAASPEEPRPPMLLDATSGFPSNELVPYVVIDLTTEMSDVGATRRIWEVGTPHRPDVVADQSMGDVRTGTVAQYWGWGVTTAQDQFARAFRAWCLRAPGGVPPFRLDKNRMVTLIEPEAAGKGLLEGDTVLSINGAVYDEQQGISAPAMGVLLGLAVGDALEIVAIRPGTGRVTASLRAAANPRTFGALEDHRPRDGIVKGGPKGWSV